MARTDSAVLPHEETAPAQEEFLHPEMDGRFTNLDEEDGTPFLRKQKRVPVRRGPLPKKTTNLLKWLWLPAYSRLSVSRTPSSIATENAHGVSASSRATRSKSRAHRTSRTVRSWMF